MGKIILNDIEYGIGISNGYNIDISNLVEKDNIVTVIDDTCTDDDIPSAKAVYDKLSDLPTDSGSKCYTTLDELGLTADATVEDVVNALKNGESFIGDIGLFTNNSTMFPIVEPNDQYSTVRIERSTNVRVIIEWYTKYGTAYAIGGIGDDGKFNGWKRVTNGGTVDLTEVNNKITQLESNQIKKLNLSNMTNERLYLKITPSSSDTFSKILMTDLYGGCILITGSIVPNYKSFKVVRLSNGEWNDYSPSITNNNKIVYVYFDGSFIYVRCDNYSKIYIEGGFNNVEKIDSIPTEATQLPILDLTQGSTGTGGGTGGVGDVVIDNASISMGRKSGTTIGNYSTALGLDVEASGKCSHAEGYNTKASKYASHAEGYSTKASGDYSHAEGRLTEAIGESSHAEGSSTTANGTASHAEGYSTTASKYASHAEGNGTTASGESSHAEGNGTTASGESSHAEGCITTASGYYSHAEGYRTKASGDYSHAEGCITTASGDYSHAGGYYTKANDYQYTIGHYNVDTTGGKSNDTTGSAFVIGNGTGDTTSLRKNAFRVAYTGATYGAGAYNTSGADYAEYFEWIDGNVDNEDRRGLFVTLDGDKIKLANDGDYILGVVSSNPVVLGNSDMEWQGRFLKDKFGSLRIEKQIIKDVDEQGNEIEKEVEWYITNPEYDPNLEYVERKDRQEWTPVGFMGQLVVIDDGTCVVNGYCKCGVNGVATKADNGYRVMKRIDENTILVLIK